MRKYRKSTQSYTCSSKSTYSHKNEIDEFSEMEQEDFVDRREIEEEDDDEEFCCESVLDDADEYLQCIEDRLTFEV